MNTITVDDRIAVVKMVQILLQRIDPKGLHVGFTEPERALEAAGDMVIDAALLDVEMPDMDGIELAKRLQKINPLINIIFITGYEEYMPDAFELYDSGYLIKPITEKALRKALSHLRYRVQSDGLQKPVTVRCFGNFEVFVNGAPVRFPQAKCRELLAYLIDRQGALCTADMIIGALWPEEPPDENKKKQVRNRLSDVINAFRAVGVDDIVIRVKNGAAVNVSAVDCDYYRWLDGDPYAIHRFKGEYMSQYEFAEETRYNLQNGGGI